MNDSIKEMQATVSNMKTFVSQMDKISLYYKYYSRGGQKKPPEDDPSKPKIILKEEDNTLDIY